MTTAATMFMMGPAAMVMLRCQMGFWLYTGSPGPSGASRSSWRLRSTAWVARSAVDIGAGLGGALGEQAVQGRA